jgi:hypothetical protein
MNAHELTTTAFKQQTSAAHLAAAAAHEQAAWNSRLSQPARGNHFAQAEKHQRIAKGLQRLGK